MKDNFNTIYQEHWAETDGAQILAIVMFGLLCAYMIWDSMRAKPED